MNKITAFLIAVIMVINVVASMGVTAHAQNYELVNPISGQVQGTGNDHAGVDIFAPLGTPIYAVSSGYIQYSERGHTHDYGKSEDTPNSVKIVMDTPIQYNGLTYTNAFYTHLSELVYDVHDGEPLSIHVNAGDLIGYSGCGNGVNHLHFSFEWVSPNNGDDWKHMTTDEVINIIGWSRSKWITALDHTTFNDYSQGNENNPYASTLTFAQIKSKFPQDKYWNASSVDSYTSSPCKCKHSSSHKNGSASAPCTCNTFGGAMQCWGFANKLAYDMYGSLPSTWTKYTGSSAVTYINNSLKPGDIVRYYNNGHSVMVVSVSGNNVVVAECNWSGYCKITYNRTVTKTELTKYKTSNLNEFVQVAPNSNPFTGETPPPPSTTLDTRYPVPMKSYPLSSADHAATAYDSINGSSIGYIYGSDYCTINKVYENGWCQVTCPWNSSTKTVYAQTSAFIQNTSYQVSSVTANSRATTYIRSTGSSTLGYIDPGDRITIVSKSGDRTQIIYPHTDGVYRLAWVNNSDLVHSHSYGSWTYADGSSHKRSCSCGDVQWGDHSWNSGTVTTSATCTSNGIRTFTCTVCNGTKTETIPALGHNYTGDYYDEAHPHAEYKKCSRCDARQNTGGQRKISSCSQCNPEVKITVYATGGSYSGESVQYAAKGDTVTLGTPTKEGYTFMGWASDENGIDGMVVSNFGRPLLPDPVFANTGNERIHVYDNKDTGHVTIEKVPKLNDTLVYSTGYNLKITSTGEGTEPALGGFYSSIDAKPNGVFYHVIYAKIPVGYELNDARNDIGDGGSSTWLTSKQGTGKWEWYIYRVNCGATGEFSNFGHIMLWGYADAANPVTWYVGLNQIYDATGLQLSSNKVVANNDIWLYATWKKNICIQHTYELVSSIPATCSAVGSKNYKCRDCGHTKTEEIPKLNHSYSANWSSDETNHWHACSGCNEKGSLSKHSWNAGVITKPATETSAGIRTYTCTVCQATKTETIPKLPSSATAKAVIDNVSARKDDIVTVNLVFKDTPVIGSCMISDPSYDTSKLRLLSGEWSVPNAVLSSNMFDEADDPYTMVIAFQDETDMNGIAAVLRFEVLADATDGVIPISATVEANNDSGDVIFNVVSGSITITSVIRGDLNGDSKVNRFDAVLLLKHTINQNRYPINQNGDMDGNGTVNRSDAIYLLKHTISPGRFPLR